MRWNYAKTFLITVTVPLFAACAPRGASGPGWPIQTYSNVCLSKSIQPFQPVCLDEFDTKSGFKYRDEFEACRLSVENFVYALDRWRECRIEEVTDISRMISKETTETMICLITSFEIEPAATDQCQPVETKFAENGIYEEEMSEAPYCVRQLGFTSKWRISLCRDDVERYLKELPRTIENLDKRIRRETEEAAQKAIRLFNCMARRESFCI